MSQISRLNFYLDSHKNAQYSPDFPNFPSFSFYLWQKKIIDEMRKVTQKCDEYMQKGTATRIIQSLVYHRTENDERLFFCFLFFRFSDSFWYYKTNKWKCDLCDMLMLLFLMTMVRGRQEKVQECENEYWLWYGCDENFLSSCWLFGSFFYEYLWIFFKSYHVSKFLRKVAIETASVLRPYEL